MIHVLAIITTKPGLRESERRDAASVGCIEYGPAVDAEGIGGFQTKLGPDTFVVVEKWDSIDALKAHAAAPHMASYGAKVKDMLAARVIHVLSPA